MIENLQTIYPVSKLLSKYIYCYYIIEDTADNFKSLHYSFPHTLNAVSIYSNGNFLNEHQKIKIKGNGGFHPFTILQGKNQNPLLVDLEGRFSRITILFKPLGLNNFIDVSLNEVMSGETTVFKQWESDNYTELLTELFAGEHITSRIIALEDCLHFLYQPFEQPVLMQSLEYLSDFTEEKSIEEIAKLVDVPLRSFNRLFKTHLGVSPVVHRQIARFRHSLENKLFDQQFKKLTEIGYNSNFYDQSYFIKLYRQLSGSNPKTFFKTVEKIGDSKLVFQYVNGKLAEKYNSEGNEVRLFVS